MLYQSIKSAIQLLAELIPLYQVAIVLAHWKGPNVYASDIWSPVEMAMGILCGKGEDINFIRELLGFDALAEISKAVKREDPAMLTPILANCLNKLIEEHDLIPSGQSDGREMRNRIFIESLFTPFLCRGNGVEFTDQIVFPKDFVTAVPETYSGVLDMTICRSRLPLAERLAKERRSCICFSNDRDVSPALRLAKLLVTCRIMKETGDSYVHAIASSRELIDNILFNRDWRK